MHRSRELEVWLCRVEELLCQWSAIGRPIDNRSQLRKACQVLSKTKGEEFLLLCFGSVARGEPAEDLDLIIISTEVSSNHEYARFNAADKSVDVNLVSLEWLKASPKDGEWGYWISESYVLFVSNCELENAWRRATNAYGGPHAARQHNHNHRQNQDNLMVASARAHELESPLFARLLMHEAYREAAIQFIRIWGNRVYSHRSFVNEIEQAMSLAGVELVLQQALLNGLVEPDSSSLMSDRYIRLRRIISTILRSETTRDLGYEQCSSRTSRISRLRGILRSSGLVKFEAYLGQNKLENMLPNIGYASIASEVFEQIASKIELTQARPYKPPLHDSSIVPNYGEMEGARWVEKKGARLKLIISTGGCKTPTCSFCALPTYGKQTATHNIIDTVDKALTKFRPTELALYNDGSLLNPEEINASVLDQVCEVISRFAIEKMWVETIPRFVSSGLIKNIKRLSGIETLVVAMGLQWVGSPSAMRELGRPDSDNIFDRAIDVIQDEGAELRIYLLWGGVNESVELQKHKLKTSLEWCFNRQINEVVICTYIPPDVSSKSYHSMKMLELFIVDVEIPRSTRVTISGLDNASCAPG